MQKNRAFKENEEWPLFNHQILQPGDSLELHVDFTPVEEAEYEAKMIYQIDGSNKIVYLKGMGRQAIVQTTVSFLHFNSTLIGNEYSDSFTLVNACDMSLPMTCNILNGEKLGFKIIEPVFTLEPFSSKEIQISLISFLIVFIYK